MMCFGEVVSLHPRLFTHYISVLNINKEFFVPPDYSHGISQCIIINKETAKYNNVKNIKDAIVI